jgi:nicotinamide phosphoribosyltransferase
MNPLNQIDFYKADHRSQYPKGTQLVFSNLTPRKTRREGVDKIVFFGLQYFVMEYMIRQWNENFFQKPKEQVVVEYKRRIETSLGKNAITFEHVEALHDLGFLPMCIMALPEGSRVPLRVPPMVMYNTRNDFFWLTNYFETILSCVIWGGCTSATTALEYKKILNHYADETVGNRDFVQWQAHDFSMRGMFGLEAACISGAGHLLSFTGTDTVPAIDFLEKYYGADCEKELIGGSVPASEHSVMCMGMQDGELETFKRFITELYPTGIVSVVSDTWDFWKVITEYLPQLKSTILKREGKLVIRPDSGDPVDIICGDQNAAPGSPEYKGAIECMWETFGGTKTDKGYKLLDSHIGLIYGDSITTDRCKAICQRLMDKGFCSYNVVFGVGSYTYQYVTRDTDGWAVKATYGEVDGKGRNIFKQPKTDDGTKFSAKGLLAVYREDGTFKCVNEASWLQVNNCAFETVFINGKLEHKQTLSQIRKILCPELSLV